MKKITVFAKIAIKNLLHIMVGNRSEKNNNYFIATFQKISFVPYAAWSNLVTPCTVVHAHTMISFSKE